MAEDPSADDAGDLILITVPIRDRDRLIDGSVRVSQGVLPDLNRLSVRGEYRKTCGWCVEQGRAVRWNERLGKDKLLAQYRAAAMQEIWLERLQGCVDGHSRGRIAVRLHPTQDSRGSLKSIAWRIAEDHYAAHTRYLDRVIPPMLEALMAEVYGSFEVPDHVMFPARLVRERLRALLTELDEEDMVEPRRHARSGGEDDGP